MFNNLNQMLPFNFWLSYTSSWRYGAETFLRILVDENIPPGHTLQEVLDFYGYNMGLAPCFAFLYGIAFIMVLIGWAALVIKNRKV